MSVELRVLAWQLAGIVAGGSLVIFLGGGPWLALVGVFVGQIAAGCIALRRYREPAA